MKSLAHIINIGRNQPHIDTSMLKLDRIRVVYITSLSAMIVRFYVGLHWHSLRTGELLSSALYASPTMNYRQTSSIDISETISEQVCLRVRMYTSYLKRQTDIVTQFNAEHCHEHNEHSSQLSVTPYL